MPRRKFIILWRKNNTTVRRHTKNNKFLSEKETIKCAHAHRVKVTSIGFTTIGITMMKEYIYE